jgi:ElaB/YqjD/DUF883 family membrane-anchored ribosome-binding protein
MAYTTDLNRPGEPYALAVPATEVDDPNVIRQQIDHTRAEMEITIQEIGERLSPENLIEQAKSSAKEATIGRINDMRYEANQKVEEISGNLGQTVRENPLPVALIGLGLGWLWMAKRNDRSYDYPERGYVYRSGPYAGYRDDPNRMGDAREWVEDTAQTAERKMAEARYRAGDAIEDVGETISDTAQRAKDSVSETVSRAGEAVGDVFEDVEERVSDTADRARQEADRLRREAKWRSEVAISRSKRSFWENMEENPLIVGAVVAVAGLAIGAAIPTSDAENQLLGETRDRFLDEAKVRAQDAVERVQTVVEDTQRAATTEAKQSAQRQNLTVEDMTGDDIDLTGDDMTGTDVGTSGSYST